MKMNRQLGPSKGDTTATSTNDHPHSVVYSNSPREGGFSNGKHPNGHSKDTVKEQHSPQGTPRGYRPSYAVAMLKKFSGGLEFIARLVMVNIPAYLLASSSELDRVCSIIFTYLCLQVVGFCWAFLVNACFALACRAPQYLFLVDIHSFKHTAQLLAAFYVSYSSIRVVISFGRSIFSIALESIKDFPDAAGLIASGKHYSLALCPLMFIPAMTLEVAMITSDIVCYDYAASPTMYGTVQSITCNKLGLKFLTESYPELKRLLFFALVVVVLQLWQLFLNQFPRWDVVFKSIPVRGRAKFQLTMFILCISTVAVLFIIPVTDMSSRWSDAQYNIILFCWTLWLYCFLPHIIRVHGQFWSEHVSQLSLQSLVAYIRISECIILTGIFLGVLFSRGYLAAQKDLTFLSIVLPALYCFMYILFVAALRTGEWLYRIALPLSVLTSFGICHMAIYSGQGSVLLVTTHILGKLVQFVGSSAVGVEPGWAPELADNDTIIHSNNKTGSGKFEDEVVAHDGDVRSSSAPDAEQIKDESASRFPSPNLRDLKKSLSDSALLSPTPIQLNSSHHARIQLRDRGSVNSSLVSIGLATHVSDHWFVKLCKEYTKSLAQLARYVAVPDSFVSGVLRVFIGIVVVLTLILAMFSVGNYAQESFQLFPRTIDMHLMKDGRILIDHRVVNATLYPRPQNVSAAANGTDTPSSGRKGRTFDTNNAGKNVTRELEKPYYASCQWRHHSLQLIDFALFSELAYFDESAEREEAGKDTSVSNKTAEEADTVEDELGERILDKQKMVDLLFPHLDFIIRNNYEPDAYMISTRNGICNATDNETCPTQQVAQNLPLPEYSGPRYVELFSPSLNLVVLALRGTDVGRFHDFMEDMKLYAEPVIFSLLSSVFMTIRFWSTDTTSSVVKLLYEFNTFFGLQSESNYYRPLAERVQEISSHPYDLPLTVPIINSNTEAPSVVITGHSMGGGLARIVGTLTGTPSVTFSPPGLGLSYKKYSLVKENGEEVKILSKGALHENSVAVITEFDW
jgi:hypothetical protein